MSDATIEYYPTFLVEEAGGTAHDEAQPSIILAT